MLIRNFSLKQETKYSHSLSAKIVQQENKQMQQQPAKIKNTRLMQYDKQTDKGIYARQNGIKFT